MLVTAGPTYEPIDAVRHIANRSSGKLGLCLATQAARRGWDVTLLLGPIETSENYTHLTVKRFSSTADLERLLFNHAPTCDVLIMAAAVADYRPIAPPTTTKLRRRDGPIDLKLEPTPDLLAKVASHRRAGQLFVGFALEPEAGLIEAAREKMNRKGINAIVANPLQTIGSDTIDATLLWRDGSVETPEDKLEKSAFASWLIDRIEQSRALNPIYTKAPDADQPPQTKIG